MPLPRKNLIRKGVLLVESSNGLFQLQIVILLVKLSTILISIRLSGDTSLLLRFP